MVLTYLNKSILFTYINKHSIDIAKAISILCSMCLLCVCYVYYRIIMLQMTFHLHHIQHYVVRVCNKLRNPQTHCLLSDIVRARRLKLFGHVARADKSQDHSRALRACIWHSPRTESGPMSFETYLAENGGGRPASIQPGFKKTQDRTTWRALTGTATSPTSPE